MRNARAVMLAAAVAGLTVAGGTAASAASVDTKATTWTAPQVAAPSLPQVKKAAVTLVWGWRP